MVGWHYRLNGLEFEQTLGDGEGQGILEWCSPFGLKVTTMKYHFTSVTVTVFKKSSSLGTSPGHPLPEMGIANAGEG